MRYYCHHCHTQINAEDLLPDFTCPSCQSGFVEEIPVTSRRNSSVDETNRTGSDDGLDPEPVSGFIATRMSSDEYLDDDEDFLDTVQGPLAQVFGMFQPQSNTPATTNTAGQSSQQQNQQQTQSDTSSTANPQAQTNRMITRSSANRPLNRNTTPGQPHSAYFDSSGNQSLADVLNDFITGVSFGTHYPDGTSSSSHNAQGASGSGPNPATRGLINIDFPLPFFLHSNPGDYAWGNSGFDAVITQLLNNLDGSNSGPPPMPKDQVDNLPTVKISDDQVKNSNLQCTVCMEDFQVGDSARQLPCEHFFHQDCILPWLNLVSRQEQVASAN